MLACPSQSLTMVSTISDQVSRSVRVTLPPIIGKALRSFLGFTISGIQLPALTQLHSIFVRDFLPVFEERGTERRCFVDGGHRRTRFGCAD